MASAVLLRIILAEMKRDITGLRWSVNAETAGLGVSSSNRYGESVNCDNHGDQRRKELDVRNRARVWTETHVGALREIRDAVRALPLSATARS